MKKNLCFLLVFIIFSLISQGQSKEPFTIKLSKSDLETTNSMLTDFAIELSYIPLETHPDGLIGDASHYKVVHVSGTGYIVYDKNNTRETALLFNEKGRFVNKIGKIGKGPGEFIQYTTLNYDPFLKRVLYLTYNGVMTYELDGEFVGRIDIESDSDAYINFMRMIVLDKDHWAVYYLIRKNDDLKEIGVLLINKEGRLINKWDLSDENHPSTIGPVYTGSLLFLNQGKLYFSHYPGYKVEVLAEDDTWDVAYIIDLPIKKPPLDYYRSSTPRIKNNLFLIDHGGLIYTSMMGKYVCLRGYTDSAFCVFYDPQTSKVLNYRRNSRFNKRGGGITNDIDGGFPIRFGNPDSEGYTYELVGAEPILDFNQRGLLHPDGKSYGEHMSLGEAIKGLQPEDNPLLVVIKMKQ